MRPQHPGHRPLKSAFVRYQTRASDAIDRQAKESGRACANMARTSLGIVFDTLLVIEPFKGRSLLISLLWAMAFS